MIYGKFPVVFLSTLASEKRGSVNSIIAAHILEHMEEVRRQGVRELARSCNVGTASISRFCKSIGLNDFAELKELLLSNRLYFERQSQKESFAERLQDYSGVLLESIRRPAASLDEQALLALCADLKKYQRIAVFGLMKAESAALSLQGDLLMMGKRVYTNIAYPQQYEYIREAGKEALVVVFSYTGAYFDYPESDWLAGKTEWPRIWMISGRRREYPPFVSRALHFDSRQDQAGHPYQLLFVAGVIAQEYARLCEAGEGAAKAP